MSIDPFLIRKQSEWADNIGKISLPKYSNKGSSVFAHVTKPMELAAIWLADAFAARSVDYPQNDFEFWCYKIGRSTALRYLYNCACIAQIILPFFATPGCAFTSGLKRLSKFIITDVICLIIYLFDLALIFRVDPAKKKIFAKPWSAFRFFCCFLLFLDILGFAVADLVGFRVVRCVFPLFLITRRTNLQKILQGLMQSGIRSISVIVALANVLLILSFVGFLVFRDIEPQDNGVQRFDYFPDAMFATLHCFTSRPFCLLALQPFFDVNPGSAFYFVTITLAADVLCIGLIVAIGTSEYKVFAANFVQKRYASRALTTRVVFDALAKDDMMDRKTWITLCKSLRRRFHRSRSEAILLFSLEDPDDSEKINYFSFLRICALLANNVVIDVPVSMNASHKSSHSLRRSSESNYSFSAGRYSNNAASLLESLTSPEDAGVNSADLPQVSIKSKFAGTRTWDFELFGSNWSLFNSLGQNFSNNCYILVTAAIVIQLPANRSVTATLRHIVLSVNYLFLVIYLCGMSAANANPKWFRFGFFVESLFWFDMVLLLGAFGFTVFLSRFLNRLNMAINVGSFIALCVLGTNSGGYSKTAPILAVVIIQSLRLLNPFFLVNDLVIFEKMLPILIRASFIYFSVVYFFAIFAHTFFCGNMDADLASEGDDDSTNWVKFSTMLNFNTFLQSLFTMFEMSILANWSIVMDAAAKVAKTRAYIFFYTFRLIVTLNVLPLLLGFVMQAFLAARKEQKLLEKQNEPIDVPIQQQDMDAHTLSTNSASGGIVLTEIRGQECRSSHVGDINDSTYNQILVSDDSSNSSVQNPGLQLPAENARYTEVQNPDSAANASPSLKHGTRKIFNPVSVSVTTQKRTPETKQYAVTASARTKSTSRLSLWASEGTGAQPNVGSQLQQGFAGTRSSTTDLETTEKDRIIDALRAELEQSRVQLEDALSKIKLQAE